MKDDNNICKWNATTGGHLQAGKRVHSKRTVADEAFIESINELIDAGDHDTVIDLVTKELRADPRNHALMLLLGNSYLSQEDLHESLSYHLRAIETHECVHTIWHLAHHMKHAGATEQAIALWKSVIELAGREDDPSMSARCKRRCRVLDDRVSVIANARFMVSVSYLQTGRPRLSQRYKRDYMRDLASGVKGMFPADATDAPNEVRVLRCIPSSK
jgi:tetratricopeptide (TPR) repeat protein